MIQARFTKEMINILKSCIGEKLLSYEYGVSLPGEAYGNLKLNFDTFSIELLNEVKETPFFDETEEISSFSCKKIKANTPFEPYCKETVSLVEINEKVRCVSVVTDCISVNRGEYEIVFDMALVVQTENQQYIFSRGWFFGEVITHFADKNTDCIYPVETVIEDWSDEGKNEVLVSREVKLL